MLPPHPTLLRQPALRRGDRLHEYRSRARIRSARGFFFQHAMRVAHSCSIFTPSPRRRAGPRSRRSEGTGAGVNTSTNTPAILMRKAQVISCCTVTWVPAFAGMTDCSMQTLASDETGRRASPNDLPAIQASRPSRSPGRGRPLHPRFWGECGGSEHGRCRATTRLPGRRQVPYAIRSRPRATSCFGPRGCIICR